MKKFNVLTAVLVAGLSLATAQVVSAQPMEHGRGDAMGHRHGGPEGIGRMLKGLDLTDSQRQQIEKLTNEFAGQKPDPATHKANAEKMVSLVRADIFDEVAARQLFEQQQAQMLEHAVARLKLQHDIRAVLTPEQKEKLDARMERMRDKMSERKKS
jgi:protein CpxP